MDEHSLAYEMLQEIKKSNKRWFIIAIIELVIIVAMVVSFFIYESQYSYESVEDIYQYTEESSSINQSLDIGE